MKKLIVFTDLDGTLLNHDDYDFSPALPAIRSLQQRQFPVVFTSSKTLAELRHLAGLMQIEAPMIYETGCGIAWPENYFPHLQTSHHSLCTTYAAIIQELRKLRAQQRLQFSGFNDMSAQEIASLTGLDMAAAQRAKAREYGEPIYWQDDDQALDHFQQLIQAAGLHVIRGGRFIHIQSPVDKSTAIKWLLQQFHLSQPDTGWQSVGLGDSPNDRQLLQSVDIAYLVRNLHLQEEQAQLMRLPGLKQTQQTGAAGWNEAISGLLEDWK